MMEQTTWLFLGLLAILTSGAAVIGRRSAFVALAGSAAAVLLWGIWAVNAYSVVTITDSGETIRQSNPALGIIGLALAVLMLANLVRVVMQLADEDDPIGVLFGAPR